jgi:hypothetical protein
VSTASKERSPASGQNLSDEDLSALKESHRDVSDLDSRTVARANEGFQHAYAVAERVLRGSLDPLSA